MVNVPQIVLSHLNWSGKGLPYSARVRFRWWQDEGPGDVLPLPAAQQGRQNCDGATFNHQLATPELTCVISHGDTQLSG